MVVATECVCDCITVLSADSGVIVLSGPSEIGPFQRSGVCHTHHRHPE